MRLKSETADIILEVTMQNYVGQLTKAHRTQAIFSLEQFFGLQAHRHLDPTLSSYYGNIKFLLEKIKCNSAKLEFNTKICNILKKSKWFSNLKNEAKVLIIKTTN